MGRTTNYAETFISVADDCPAEVGEVPRERASATIARMQYEMIRENPYRYTSDEVIFAIHMIRNEVPAEDADAERIAFFSKGRACLRSSPLAKRYGWGIHHDAQACVALYPRGSEEYRRLSQDSTLKQLKAMKSSR